METIKAIIAGENDAGLARTNPRMVLRHPANSTSGRIYYGRGVGCRRAVPAAAGPTRNGR